MNVAGKKYEFKTQPWEHQIKALRLSWGKRGFAYLMEMGTGKSKVAVDEASMYFEQGLIDGWVVMAPKGVYENWIRLEIPTHMPERVRERTDVVVWRAGGGAAKNQRLLEDALDEDPSRLTTLVMNVEALSTPGRAREYLEQFLLAHRCMMHLDESTTIKNYTSARAKAAMDLGSLARYRRIMTGSPVTKGPLDLFSQFQFLEPGILGVRSFYAFRARYAVMQQKSFGGRKFSVVVGYRNVDDLAERIAPHSFRVTKDQCLDLPPKIYTTRDVELTKEQTAAYVSLRDDALAVFGDEGSLMTTTMVITQLLRLQQLICGYAIDDDGDEHEVPSNRVDDLMAAVAEMDGKVIIWSRFRANITSIDTALRAEYGANSTAEYHGGNVATREQDVVRFKTDPACRFMLSNQQSGGYGNTWTVATFVIYFSNDFSYERRIQSEDRPHRAGQTKSVTYVDLIARLPDGSPTIDGKIVDTLRRNMDVAASITGDGYREWIV